MYTGWPHTYQILVLVRVEDALPKGDVNVVVVNLHKVEVGQRIIITQDLVAQGVERSLHIKMHFTVTSSEHTLEGRHVQITNKAKQTLNNNNKTFIVFFCFLKLSGTKVWIKVSRINVNTLTEVIIISGFNDFALFLLDHRRHKISYK